MSIFERNTILLPRTMTSWFCWKICVRPWNDHHCRFNKQEKHILFKSTKAQFLSTIPNDRDTFLLFVRKNTMLWLHPCSNYYPKELSVHGNICFPCLWEVTRINFICYWFHDNTRKCKPINKIRLKSLVFLIHFKVFK